MSKLYIDMGHGGEDPGAVSQGVEEATRALKWGNILIGELSTYRNAYETIPSREGDEPLTLGARTNEANATNCDYFISLHFNAFDKPSANGIETYHFPGSNLGQKAAMIIQDNLINDTGLTNRGVKDASFYVLTNTHMPAVLLEAGFITNPKERGLINSSDYLNTLAKSVAKSVDTLVS